MEGAFIKRLNRYFHDEESKYFGKRHASRIERESRFYKDIFARLGGRISNRPISILDIGTGRGMIPGALPASGDNRVVCADISYGMLEQTKADLERDGHRLINYVVCDAEKLPFRAGAFDIITCNAAMHHLPSITDFSRQTWRVLAAGGALVIGFEPNRRFWTNALVSLPYRLIKKLSPASDSSPHSYKEVCLEVNKRLAKEGLIDRPLSLSEMIGCVDVHSPNAQDRLDYSKGFDMDELMKGPFRDYAATAFYHYDEDNRFFGAFNRILFPRSAPQFSLFLKKRPKARIKVLYLYVHTNFGGAEIGLLTTLRHIDRSRFDCIVVSIEKKGALGGEIERMGIKGIYLDSSARIFNLGLVKKIARILKQEKPDILHASLFYANFFGRLAALFHRPAVLVTEERSVYTEKRFYHVIIDNLLSRMTDRIITCSRSVTDFTEKQEGIPRSKFHLIYNAVDSDRFDACRTKSDIRLDLGFENGNFVIGTVGSVIPKKGHRFLVEAFGMLKRDIPSAKLVVVGDGESRAGLIKLADDLGVTDDVSFLGFRRDIPEIMKAMDVFVLPSLQEGFPRTVVEAMYMGLPVIASNISGVPEIISNGENGFLVPAKDPKALANRISALYRDPSLVNTIGLKAKRKIESGYLPQNYVSALQRLYEELLEKNTGGRRPPWQI